MRNLCFAAFLLLQSCDSQTPQKNQRPAEDITGDIAFVHVNVLTMESEGLLRDQTVLVHDKKIEKIGPASSETIPSSYFIIDSNGSYLLPGLSDLHTHVWYEEDLLPYVANGVTTVLNMGSGAIILQLREKASKGEIISPTIYASAYVDGPGSRGWYARTPAEAEEAVVEIKTGGWDFIKVYNSIPLDAFNVLMAKAKTENIAVIGHGVRSAGMPGIFDAGQVMVAHAEEFLYTYFNNVPDESRISAAVTMTKSAGVFVTPNLGGYEAITRQWGNPAALQTMLSADEIAYVSPKWKDGLWNQVGYTNRSGSLTTNYEFLKKLTKAFHAGGVPLLAGTDSPFIPGQANGFAIHEDLRNLVVCGLTPYQALETATRIPGEFFSEYIPGIQPVGLIKEGYRCDLLLVGDNPLNDLTVLRNRIGVMINGRWLSEKALSAEMEKLVGR